MNISIKVTVNRVEEYLEYNLSPIPATATIHFAKALEKNYGFDAMEIRDSKVSLEQNKDMSLEEFMTHVAKKGGRDDAIHATMVLPNTGVEIGMRAWRIPRGYYKKSV